MVGEYERAFTGTQFVTLYTWCTRHGIQLWLPETGGPVDLGNPDHRALLSLLTTQSQREILRARHRVLAAMHNQATQQGRYLGGRLRESGQFIVCNKAEWRLETINSA